MPRAGSYRAVPDDARLRQPRLRGRTAHLLHMSMSHAAASSGVSMRQQLLCAVEGVEALERLLVTLRGVMSTRQVQEVRAAIRWHAQLLPPSGNSAQIGARHDAAAAAAFRLYRAILVQRQRLGEHTSTALQRVQHLEDLTAELQPAARPQRRQIGRGRSVFDDTSLAPLHLGARRIRAVHLELASHVVASGVWPPRSQVLADVGRLWLRATSAAVVAEPERCSARGLDV